MYINQKIIKFFFIEDFLFIDSLIHYMDSKVEAHVKVQSNLVTMLLAGIVPLPLRFQILEKNLTDFRRLELNQGQPAMAKIPLIWSFTIFAH
jgi:hypothetical protein